MKEHEKDIRNLKVLIIFSGSASGGVSGESTVAWADYIGLREKGVDAVIQEYRPRNGDYKGLGSLFSLVGYIWSPRAYVFVEKMIKLERPQIVHFHGIFPFLSPSALRAAHDSNVGVVQTLHNGRWLCLEGGFYRNRRFCDDCVGKTQVYGVFHGCYRGSAPSLLVFLANKLSLKKNRLFNWVDRFVAVSGFVKELHVRAGFPSEKVVVKLNSIELSLRPELFKGNDVRKGVVYVGRISEGKGSRVLEYLIRNLSGDIQIIGDGPALDHLRNLCIEHGFRHVKFWGRLAREQCLSVMSRSVCTVVPSQCGESFSLAAAESMLVETPVVAADIGGLGDLIRESGGGVAVKYDVMADYVKAIDSFISDSNLATAVGRNGKEYVGKHLSVGIGSNNLLNIYAEVLREKSFNADIL
jgi:glycosyltransferase involved in cell wall biosynthesis